MLNTAVLEYEEINIQLQYVKKLESYHTCLYNKKKGKQTENQ
jgi:hypothetical protein